MYELTYCSIADNEISQQDISDILETSIEFNKANNITGCLLFHNKEFIQLLEGDEKIVEELYARIRKDKRHRNVTLLKTGYKDERTFSKWSMAYHNSSEDNDPEREEFIRNLVSFSEIAEPKTTAAKLFWKVVKITLFSNSQS